MDYLSAKSEINKAPKVNLKDLLLEAAVMLIAAGVLLQLL